MPKDRKQITCGRKCGTTLGARNRKQPKSYGIRPCRNCGKQMEAKTSTNCYCCEQCRIEGTRTRSREQYRAKVARQQGGEPFSSEHCKWCGRRFTVLHYGQEYCSDQCAKWGAQQYCSNKDGEWVKIQITKRLDVNAEFRPEYQRTYRAKKIPGISKVSYLIPEIGRYGLLVREEECKEVLE